MRVEFDTTILWGAFHDPIGELRVLRPGQLAGALGLIEAGGLEVKRGIV